jgi:hypothetical protein
MPMTANKKYNKNWETSCERFVAFFDIMGFKDYLSRHTHAEVYNEMSKISKNINQIYSIKEQKFPLFAGKIHTATFSDSIILFSKDNSIDSFNSFSLITAWLFKSIIKDSFPVKGAIAHGKIVVNKSNNIYFGQPIIDAYELQEDVNYYGIVAHHTIEEYLSKNDTTKFFEMIYFDTDTPLKSGNIHHYNIDWFNYNIRANRDPNETKNQIIAKIKNFRINTSGRPRIYIDNTLRILESKESRYNPPFI